jgi:hypothetical protein
MADAPRPEPAAAPEPARPAQRDARDSAGPAEPAESDAAPRSPDDYTEPPGSHRRPDGAATDVGA